MCSLLAIEKIFLKDSLLTMFFLQSHWGVLGELGSAFIEGPSVLQRAHEEGRYLGFFQ
jgi:hypothetical protein